MHIGRSCQDWDPWCSSMRDLLAIRLLGVIRIFFHLGGAFFLFAFLWTFSWFFLYMFAGLLFVASQENIFLIPPNLCESPNVLDGGPFFLMGLKILVTSINTIQKQWEEHDIQRNA